MLCPKCGRDSSNPLSCTPRDTVRNADPTYRVCVCGHIYHVSRAGATESHDIERDVHVYGKPYLTMGKYGNGRHT